MKIIVMCEACNQAAEYKPEHEMYEVGVYTIEDKFLVGVDWDNEIKDNINEDFLTDLTESSTIERTTEVLVNDITKNIYADTSDFDLCFTCKSCGDQIILNDFQLK
ncbi:hypothetical protein [Planococcus sp. YIM B11945]|uniref:hypothetical protein n=1 Tax=Planococcus sp. YIM B11945 TaxID=3435410 RepID=UPI003D7E36F6